MKSLINYLYEVNLTKLDYNKHNFKYRDEVINTILNDTHILLGNHGEEVFPINPDIQRKLRNEFIINPDSVFIFNDIMTKYGLPTWNKIYKGTYSGKHTDTDGQWAESLVCYLYNNNTDDVLDWISDNKQLSEKWINNCIFTSNFINSKWSNKDYIMCHVDGKDYNLSSNYKFAKTIASLFKGKGNMKKIFNVNCNDLYSGSKDTWNKADVVLIHKSKALNIIDDMKKVVIDGKSINNMLIQYLNDGIVIPISLKELTPNKAVHIDLVNGQNSGNQINVKEVVSIRFSNKYEEYKHTGNVDIICVDQNDALIYITFRSNTNGNNALNVEPKCPAAKYRLGKAVSVMKNMLNIDNTNSYYVEADNLEDAISILKSYGFYKIDNIKSNLDDLTPSIVSRACLAGLLGMLKRFKDIKNVKIDEDFPKKFCNFCLMCATGKNSAGAFYKISN